MSLKILNTQYIEKLFTIRDDQLNVRYSLSQKVFFIFFFLKSEKS